MGRKMKYTMRDLYDFMDAGRPVKVTCTDGQIFTGLCWAYYDVIDMRDSDIEEPYLEVQDTALRLNKIDRIEFIG